MTSDKNTFLQEEDSSTKHKLMSVGDCGDTLSDLVEGNDDGKHPCLGNGQTVLMRTPTQLSLKNVGARPSALVDDPHFRKVLVTTSRMDQTVVCMGKGTTLGKRDTTFPYHE
jgi:hypothetical protein